MTTGEIATVLRCTDRTVRRMCAAGDLPAKRCGGRWLLKREALYAWLRIAPPANDVSTAAAAA